MKNPRPTGWWGGGSLSCPDAASLARVRVRGGTLDPMSADTVNVRLVGGPMDGATLPVPKTELDDAEPGYDFVPPDESSAPPGCTRVLYTSDPDGPPDVWRWRSWVP